MVASKIIPKSRKQGELKFLCHYHSAGSHPARKRRGNCWESNDCPSFWITNSGFSLSTCILMPRQNSHKFFPVLMNSKFRS